MSSILTPERLNDLAASNNAPALEFAYVDETGNTGDVARGGSRTFTLGCHLIPVDDWALRLEALTETRRDIKQVYGVRLRDELKAYYLIRPRGTLKGSGLGDRQLRDIYRRVMKVLALVSTGVFGVVVDKEQPLSADPFTIAWQELIRQLAIRSVNRGHPIMLVHDNGEDHKVRTLYRLARESCATGSDGHVAADLLVEDPVSRRSELSYFIQAADLVAYAAFRRVQPPGKNNATVCDERMWLEVKSGLAAKMCVR
ncbi:DUF3800 domain-containing protein [Phytoactinopolyspora halotolerans]|uniref:DUF3800 domain-containing protein n=1 Tax=Phytoactinopolyspora halotolerans TaxID=1981512 RepID=A0A6L9S8X9_9ACTN|nr:DUF3800 domain-containing protein [Phytoactinopolyspora halotolerans]NEE01676.1 DUF3800 domain-containing protein [Phytoactinopolyspora halotolerans]